MLPSRSAHHDLVREAVDLEEYHARDVGRSSPLTRGGSPDDVAVVEVVVVVDSQERRDVRVHYCQDEGYDDPPEHPDPEAVDDTRCYPHDDAVQE